LAEAPITAERLGEAIQLCDRRRRVLRDINRLRSLDEPPLSGLDALLVSQIALSQDIRAFIKNAEILLDELRDRAARGISAYERPGMRVVLAGSPSPLGYAKVHYVVESAGMRIVADESCTGTRYFRDLVGPVPGDLESMLSAIADRYLKIDCACFSPNQERVDNLRKMIDDYRAQGVVHTILQFCHGFDIEAKVLDRALAAAKVPSIKIVTDYSEEDVEQIRVRLEAFREVSDA
jgi:benzoyl-CoA reductase/2-hydroxyglutaryl-CoA dehydratase subunit BcrC/BadD/HgdB